MKLRKQQAKATTNEMSLNVEPRITFVSQPDVISIAWCVHLFPTSGDKMPKAHDACGIDLRHNHLTHIETTKTEVAICAYSRCVCIVMWPESMVRCGLCF